VGPNAHVHDSTFNQLWKQFSEHIDLPTLADELGRCEWRFERRQRLQKTIKSSQMLDRQNWPLGAATAQAPCDICGVLESGALGVATGIGVELAASVSRPLPGFSFGLNLWLRIGLCAERIVWVRRLTRRAAANGASLALCSTTYVRCTNMPLKICGARYRLSASRGLATKDR